MMNQEVKKKWVNALRSGEYEQGRSFLRSREDKFCCLGVLCDLYAKETGKDLWKPKYHDAIAFGDRSYLPPEYVIDWAELKDDAPDIIVNGDEETSLPMYNDGGATFEEIADIIEEQL